jgi:hypothetical protein
MAEAEAGSTAEAGSGSKRKFEDSKCFEEREQEVLQRITSSSIEQLRHHMLKLIEAMVAKQ